MPRLLLTLIFSFVGSIGTSGFLQPQQPVSLRSFITSNNKVETQSRLFMSNETIPENKDSQTNPMASVKKGLDAFSATGSYRTLLFCGAFLGSPKVRDFIGIPGCIGVVAITWGVYTYDNRFNYLVDVVTPKRQRALRELREAKAAQLSSTMSNSESNFEDLAAAYEQALRDELATRVIIPGLWAIEMDPTQEDRAAAQQFLGLEITDGLTLEPLQKN